jgi:hypothetical protein
VMAREKLAAMTYPNRISYKAVPPKNKKPQVRFKGPVVDHAQ